MALPVRHRPDGEDDPRGDNSTPATIRRRSGEWGQFSTPTSPGGGIVSSSSAGITVWRGQALLYTIALILIFSQLLIFISYEKRSSTTTHDDHNEYFEPRLLSSGDRSPGEPVSLRGEMGYLDVTIPERVIQLLKQTNDDDLVTKEEGDLSSEETDENNEENDDDVFDNSDNKVYVKPFKGFAWLRRREKRRQTPHFFEGERIVVDNKLTMNKQKVPEWDPNTMFELTWSYLAEEKIPLYVGSEYWMAKLKPGSRQWLNSVAVFPHSNTGGEEITRQHGLLGVYPNGTQAWNPKPSPKPIGEVQNRTEAMRRGGFYLDLSNSMAMDRMSPDHREKICLNDINLVDYQNLEDASIIITFYNEPLSTLLRSVHSVLNLTPPSLIREIILVDDYSDLPENVPGSELYEYIKLLPKVTILRLTERRGLVWARLAGARHAKAPVYVILDSHIEVNIGWLEPQLQRIKESPKSIVFPQIMALEADTFEYNRHSGIGCWLSWKWNMVEQASLTAELKNTSPIPSASMAGGLFAVHRDWFWEIGGYDEGFSMWGSENVEMGFRTWMCGGRLECTPCSRTFHVYRQEGVGYASPSQAVIRNKLRTARVWMDEYYELAKYFTGTEDKLESGLGNIDRMIELKERLQCKDFKWFMREVDPTHEFQNLSQIEVLGEIRNGDTCIDSMNHDKPGKPYNLYSCHGLKGNQGWLKSSESGHIHSLINEKNCMGWNRNDNMPEIQECTDASAGTWRVDFVDIQKRRALLWYSDNECLSVRDRDSNGSYLFLDTLCSTDNLNQIWQFEPFSLSGHKPIEYSEEYKARKKKSANLNGIYTDVTIPSSHTSSTEAPIPL